MTLRAVVVVAALAVPTLAVADSKTEAQHHVDRATALHGKSQFAAASAELAIAYALDPRPELLYALGQLRVALGNCAEATAFYNRFLTTRPEPGPAAAASEAIATCKDTGRAIDAKLEAKRRVRAASLLHDGQQFEQARGELVVAYALDPDPSVLYAIGQLEVKLEHCDQAILFYDRFTAASPDLAISAGVADAVDACKAKLATKPPIVAPAPVAPPVALAHAHHWYKDRLGLGLLGGGVALGIAGVFTYRAAHADLDAADAAKTYARQEELVDRAHRKRTYAVLFGGAAAAVTFAAVIRFVVLERTPESRGFVVVPAADGGLVAWSTGF